MDSPLNECRERGSCIEPLFHFRHKFKLTRKMKQEKSTEVNYSLDKVFNFLSNGNNYISKSIERVKLNKSGTAANASIPGLGIIRIDLKADKENNTIKVYSNQIGTVITAKLQEAGEKTKINFSINCEPNLGFIKNSAILLAMPKVMDTMIVEIKKAVIE
jgi:hypothetical protein